MKKIILIQLAAIIMALQGYSQICQPIDAANIAGKWIQIIIDEQGSWAGNDVAYPGPIEQFRQKGRLIGYFCNVNPRGFIVFSLRRELAPVKAWSDENNLNPFEEVGIAEVIKTCMSRIIDTVESRYGAIEYINSSDLKSMAEIDYSSGWTLIKDYIPGSNKKKQNPTDNYQEGEVLLTSIWHQLPPYNNNCPDLGCTNTSNGRAIVGCTATAGAQIMKYWSWPPYGVMSPYSDLYDWANMEDNVTTSSPAAQQAAVAELNAEVGQAVEMDYGCTASGAPLEPMVDVFIDIYYYHSSCMHTGRSGHTANGWFDLIKWNINGNRPIQYDIHGTLDHSLVCDGWKEYSLAPLLIKAYHMNYGWQNTGVNIWYILDEIPGSNIENESMVQYIVPSTALGANLSGTYPTYQFPYRYFDKDAAGSNATFNSGHKLQFLPGVKVTGTGTTSSVRFTGTLYNNIHLFTGGDISHGIRVQNGVVKLTNFGTIKLLD